MRGSILCVFCLLFRAELCCSGGMSFGGSGSGGGGGGGIGLGFGSSTTNTNTTTNTASASISISNREILLTDLISFDLSFANLTAVIKEILGQLRSTQQRCTILESDLADKNKQLMIVFDRLSNYDSQMHSVHSKIKEMNGEGDEDGSGGSGLGSTSAFLARKNQSLKEREAEKKLLNDLKHDLDERKSEWKTVDARLAQTESVLKGAGLDGSGGGGASASGSGTDGKSGSSGGGGMTLGQKLESFDKSIAEQKQAVTTAKSDVATLNKLIASVQDTLKSTSVRSLFCFCLLLLLTD